MSYSSYNDRESAPMLDAFIIDKIRQDREQQRKGVPMRIHVPNPEDDPRWREQQQRQQKEKEEKGPSRGVTIIDYSI
jgi:hypothetical protein